MSQNKVYNILKDLDGEASSSGVIKEAEERYPDTSLSEYVTIRLRALEEKEVVEEISNQVEDTGKSLYWRIVDENWDGVPEDVANKDFPKK